MIIIKSRSNLASLTLSAVNALIFTAASAEIIPGATSLLFRNNADNATNLSITDAGVVAIRAATTITAGDFTTSSGAIHGTKPGIATTATTGIRALNSTAATAGVTLQYSPSIVLQGQAWDSDDLLSRNAAFHMYVVPTSAATILGDLIIAWETPVGGTLNTRFTFTSGGNLTTVGGITCVACNAGAGNLSTSALFRSLTSGTSWDLNQGNGIAVLAKNGNTAGARLSASTDGTIAIQTFAGAAGTLVAGPTTLSGILTLSDVNLVTGTTTGTKFGTATTQKLSFWNATPVVQGAAVADASGGAIIDAEARTALNTLLARMRTYGLIAT